MKEMDVLLEALGKYGFTSTVSHALKFLLRNPYESLVIVDKEAKIQFMDRGSERFFGIMHGDAEGKDIREFIPQSGLPVTLETGIPVIGRIFEVKNKKRISSVYPIILDKKIIGALGKATFGSLEEVERISNEIYKLKKEVNYFKEKEKTEHAATYTFDNILGESALMKDAIELAKKISFINTDVLIIGESGAGKELFAHSIHNLANRQRPFIKVNCPAIPFELAESELFGYEKGAFSGATPQGKPGKFEIADGGTIFLDEIPSLPLSMQAKLLRVLQEREMERLGGTKTKRIDVRAIFTANTDLKGLVNEGKFRDDLYYRMSKAIIRLPSLRERREDIPLYISHFLDRINRSFKTRIKGVSKAAMERLTNYDWPGNVRELINVLEQSVLKAWNNKEISEDHITPEITSGYPTIKETPAKNFKTEIEKKEKELILTAILEVKGNKRKAAAFLNMPRSTFYEKLKRYNLV